ncbi:GFA family protein [Pontivivens nitratireducens]|uniref:GFA family protein n=1 Tax=Pontivivens nitratireducens TaxID=2758038 RepID=UPI00201BBC2A|nr:GFA family protein [Pontibrevibacter nitratireducens]
MATGKCMCGAVVLTIGELPHEYGTCHCEMCRRWAGSALLSVSVPQDDLTIAGAEHVRTIQSSDWAERAWCDKCGSGLWYRVTADVPHAGTYEIPIGLLDDANGLTMTREIFIDEKPDAFTFAGTRELMNRAEVLALYGVTT